MGQPLPEAYDFLIRNIGQLVTMAGSVDEPRRGAEMADIGIVENAAIAALDGRIVWVGSDAQAQVAPDSSARILDAGGACVTPGYVDPHTHAVFGRTRQDEYERRNRGETYLEIAAAGGGIHASVRDLRERGRDELLALTIERLRELRAFGTTTVEIKSGYGLSLDDELKMLEIAGAAAEALGLNVVRTCLAAHEVPQEFKNDRAGYIDLIISEILPAVVASGLADRLDVFCEPTVFNLEETAAILQAGQALGLRATVHADELEPFGGAALAAALGADSADHLIRIDETGIAALAASDTVAVLLPGTVFTLGLDHYAPARAMIDAGATVALATDFNPGSCPIRSMPLIMAIACTQMKLSPAEALTACTINSAFALGVADRVGSLAVGKRADLLILDVDDYRLVPYYAGHNPVAKVIMNGEEV
jgi:imidazolonepropionase